MIDSTAVDMTPERSVAPTSDESVLLLNAVCDPVRWAVLRQLSVAKACVCDLQAEVDVAPNLLSYHLRVLRDSGLVTASRRGRWVDYELAADAAARLSSALPVPEVGRS